MKRKTKVKWNRSADGYQIGYTIGSFIQVWQEHDGYHVTIEPIVGPIVTPPHNFPTQCEARQWAESVFSEEAP